MIYVILNPETTEFEAIIGEDKIKYPGTVEGAVALVKFIIEKELEMYHSSDLNHPDEFPNFEPYAIDIVCGEFEGAIKAGVLPLKKIIGII